LEEIKPDYIAAGATTGLWRSAAGRPRLVWELLAGWNGVC